jgi:hypothetical protein
LTWLFGTVELAELILLKDFRMDNYVVEDLQYGRRWYNEQGWDARRMEGE